jgi:ABC-type transport system substrate-binding protein
MLATAWEREPSGGWRFRIRPGVRLHDGSLLDAATVATVVKAREGSWNVTAGDGFITVDPALGPQDVVWALARREMAIAVRQPSGMWIGSGPFRIDQMDAARMRLAAHEAYWNGRSFVDVIQVEFGRAPAVQMADLEAGRLDVASARPADVRRSAQRQVRTFVSQPVDLVVLAFEPHRGTDATAALRRTMAAAFDRQAIARVVAQGQAEPATALVPAWIGGYVLPPAQGRPLAPAAVAALPIEERTFPLRVPADDPVLRAIADRLVVDAQQAGISMTVQAPAGRVAPRADARLLRIPVEVTSPERALSGIVVALGPRMVPLMPGVSPRPGAPVEDVVRFESAVAERRALVPIVHLPDIAAAAPRVEGWTGPLVSAGGHWDLANVWLRAPETAPR